MIHATVVHAAHLHGVRRLLYLGSSCIYPRDCPQPIREEYLLTGLLEPTNEPYAIAKISGIKLCQAYRRQYGSDFISAMPTNLYGPHDNFDLQSSHVLPALMRKFHDAGADRRGRGRGLGHRHPPARVPPRRRPRRRLPLPDAPLRRGRAHQRRHRRGPRASASWPRRSATWSAPGARLVFDPDEARRHAAQAPRRQPPPRPRLAPPHRPRGGDPQHLRVVPRRTTGGPRPGPPSRA